MRSICSGEGRPPTACCAQLCCREISRRSRSSRSTTACPAMHPAERSRRAKELRMSFLQTPRDAWQSPAATLHSMNGDGGRNSMLLLGLLLLAAPEDLQNRIRHLESEGSAEAPVSSPDGSRVAFVTTLFGTRQVASMAADGGYPNQLSDEPGGVVGLRYAPNDPKVLIAIALRGERRRLVF